MAINERNRGGNIKYQKFMQKIGVEKSRNKYGEGFLRNHRQPLLSCFFCSAFSKSLSFLNFFKKNKKGKKGNHGNERTITRSSYYTR